MSDTPIESLAFFMRCSRFIYHCHPSEDVDHLSEEYWSELKSAEQAYIWHISNLLDSYDLLVRAGASKRMLDSMRSVILRTLSAARDSVDKKRKLAPPI